MLQVSEVGCCTGGDADCPISVSDRRGSGKPRPKSEGFELYNNSAQNGSPESPPMPWVEYSEPKKLPGDDRLVKNRADHRSSPNVASKRGRVIASILLADTEAKLGKL